MVNNAIDAFRGFVVAGLDAIGDQKADLTNPLKKGKGGKEDMFEIKDEAHFGELVGQVVAKVLAEKESTDTTEEKDETSADESKTTDKEEKKTEKTEKTETDSDESGTAQILKAVTDLSEKVSTLEKKQQVFGDQLSSDAASQETDGLEKEEDDQASGKKKSVFSGLLTKAASK